MEFSFVSVFSLSLFLSFSFFMPSHLVFYFFIFFKIPYEIANTCLATIYNSIGLTLLDLSLCRFNNNNNKNTLRDLCVYVFFHSSCSLACSVILLVFRLIQNDILIFFWVLSECVNCFSHSFVCSFSLSYVCHFCVCHSFVRSFVRLSIIHFTACYGLWLMFIHTFIHLKCAEE